MTLLEKLQAMRCKPSVVARVLKLNPKPVEGARLRGWHRKARLWECDMIGPSEFIKTLGVPAYRLVDKSHWKALGGTRKAMARTDFLDNVWRVPVAKNFRVYGSHGL